MSLGQICYTYSPSKDEDEAGKIALEFNREDLEQLSGFVHKIDNIQHAFLHKSSQHKFHVPYNDPRYEGNAKNTFQYHLNVHAVRDFYNSGKEHCADADTNKDDQTALNDEQLLLNNLEEQLGCKLPWNGPTGKYVDEQS